MATPKPRAEAHDDRHREQPVRRAGLQRPSPLRADEAEDADFADEDDELEDDELEDDDDELVDEDEDEADEGEEPEDDDATTSLAKSPVRPRPRASRRGRHRQPGGGRHGALGARARRPLDRGRSRRRDGRGGRDRGGVRLSLHVAQGDMGRIIGRRGRTAQALRTLVRAAAARDGQEASVDIVD